MLLNKCPKPDSTETHYGPNYHQGVPRFQCQRSAGAIKANLNYFGYRVLNFERTMRSVVVTPHTSRLRVQHVAKSRDAFPGKRLRERDLGACNMHQSRAWRRRRPYSKPARSITEHAEVPTHRSLLRRQLEVSGRPPSPSSRCHINTVPWDPNSCLHSSSAYLPTN